jgi:hypothetical protein
MQAIVLGFIRHALTAAGGALVAKGYIDSTGLESVIGGLITAVGAAWSAYDKRQQGA